MMCGIDTAIEAIRTVRQVCQFPEADMIINRLDYHRSQAEGVKPKYYKADTVLHSYYKCGNCGHRLEINDNFCPNCGYRIKWDSCRCLTGLPLVDAAERAKDDTNKEFV